jgi:hypothetical protein
MSVLGAVTSGAARRLKHKNSWRGDIVEPGIERLVSVGELRGRRLVTNATT